MVTVKTMEAVLVLMDGPVNIVNSKRWMWSKVMVGRVKSTWTKKLISPRLTSVVIPFATMVVNALKPSAFNQTAALQSRVIAIVPLLLMKSICTLGLAASFPTPKSAGSPERVKIRAQPSFVPIMEVVEILPSSAVTVLADFLGLPVNTKSMVPTAARGAIVVAKSVATEFAIMEESVLPPRSTTKSPVSRKQVTSATALRPTMTR